MTGDSGTDVVTFPYVNTAEVVTLATILPIICIIVVCLRFHTRTSKQYSVGLDDWLMVPGALLYTGMCICMLIGAANRVIGYRSSEKTNPDLPTYLVPENALFAKLFFAFQIQLVIAFGFVKCSIVALYRRIFVSERNSAFDIVCKIMYGSIVGWSITFFIIVSLSCGPKPWAYWRTEDERATCGTFTPTRGLAGTDMVIDVILMVLPQPLIWNLGLPVSKKIAISVLIVLGCACIGADIAQTILFSQIQKASELGIFLDQNEIITLVMYYTCIDGGLAVTAACLVTLRPLFRNTSVQSLMQGIRSGLSKHSTTGTSAGGSTLMGGSKNSRGTQDTDVESGIWSVDANGRRAKIQIRRTSESLALSQIKRADKNDGTFVDVQEVHSPYKRTSDSIALVSASQCSHCGH